MEKEQLSINNIKRDREYIYIYIYFFFGIYAEMKFRIFNGRKNSQVNLWSAVAGFVDRK